jgi:hypothetical protein
MQSQIAVNSPNYLSTIMKKAWLVTFLLLPLAAGAQSKELSIGCWKMPSRAGETLQLNRDGNFNFNDYNTNTKETENLYGTWKQAGNKIVLMYNDRPQQTFTVSKNKAGKWTLPGDTPPSSRLTAA